MPALLILALFIGHREDPIYRDFLAAFAARVGEPLSMMLLASASFYAYAALRGTPCAVEALTSVLAALAVVGPDTLDQRELVSWQPAPLLAAAALQLGFGAGRRDSWRCLMGLGLTALAALSLATPLRGLIVFHLTLFGVLLIGAALDDSLARFLRVAGSTLVLLACLVALLGRFEDPIDSPPWAIGLYPLVMAALLAAYGRLIRQRFSLMAAVLVLAIWLAGAGWRGYIWLRQVVVGLDHILLSLALFGLALLISLGKSGMFSRWIAVRRTGLREAAGTSPSPDD